MNFGSNPSLQHISLLNFLLTFMVAPFLNASESPSTIPKIHFGDEYVVSGNFAQYLFIYFFSIISNTSLTIIHNRNFSYSCSLHSWLFYDNEHAYSSISVPYHLLILVYNLEDSHCSAFKMPFF